jgi:hypothetical protein
MDHTGNRQTSKSHNITVEVTEIPLGLIAMDHTGNRQTSKSHNITVEVTEIRLIYKPLSQISINKIKYSQHLFFNSDQQSTTVILLLATYLPR